MSHNATQHNLGLTLATLIVPTLIVAIAPRLTAIPGPSTASATPNPQTTETTPTTTKPTSLTEAQHAALAHRQSLINTQADNPFHYPTPQNAAPSPYDNDLTPPTEQTTDNTTAPPTMLITSIAAAQGKGIAIINGTLRREGETIAEAWTITNINPATRTITIQHTNGTTHTESQTR